jgi:hypothetical protein
LWRRFTRIAVEILDEVFDQSAYRRHLAALGVEHSGAEWRRFSDARWEGKARRGRCC